MSEQSPTAPAAAASGEHPRRRLALAAAGVLLAAPVVAMLWVTSYAKAEPRLWGFPFFYWYQLMWVPIASVLTYVAYRLVRSTAPTRVRLGDGSDR